MAGYSKTPLSKKLGLKDGLTVYVVGEPATYWDWLAPLPDIRVVQKPVEGIDFAHLFVQSQREFEKAFVKLKARLARTGMLWISWPKKASGVVTDLDENKIRDFGLAQGLVDVKVCAVDDTWSGLKFVYRIHDR